MGSLLSGKTLCGEAAAQVLDPIPSENIRRIMVSEIDDLIPELQDDTRNVLLTLVRIWDTLVTNEIKSKQDAATWAIDKLPDKFKPTLEHALAVRVGKEEEDWRYLVSEIKKLENL